MAGRAPRPTSAVADLTPTEAVAEQRRLAGRVIEERTFEAPSTVAGADVSVKDGRVRAAVAVLSFPGLEPLEVVTADRPVEFPYVPGLLAFREIPALLEAWERLEHAPDVVLVDGHGRAHPRRFGLACHLGVLLDVPTLGCGKSRLVGEHRTPGPRRGARTQVRHRDEVVGACLRTRAEVSPVYVSVGHRIDLASACRLVLACAPRYRLPETTRVADRAAALGAR